MPLDIDTIRSQFPALKSQAIFFDNPGGTQVPQAVIDRMSDYLIQLNANHGGAFATSRASDELLAEARSAAADFLAAARPEEIVFGPNMTTLTFHISRSLAYRLQPGDHLVVTHLDHDANISPWLRVAEERNCQVHWVDFDLENGTLNLESYHQALEHKPRLVAIGYASNALGTINPLRQMIAAAHQVGALVYVDAVHYTPHGGIDVQALGCDFLVCSAYKFFGPHLGILYGRYDLLAELNAYKVRPAPNEPPGKFETGTQNHEGIAGLLGALEYLQWLGVTFGEEFRTKYSPCYTGRQLHLKLAMAAIRAYEYELSRALLTTLKEISGVQLYGLNDLRRLEERVPTFSFTLKGWHPRQVAQALDEKHIYVWDGNYYALAVTTRLDVEESGGMVRVGPVHYNSLEEISRFGEVLTKLSKP